jgi:hypothetical protein
MGFPAPWANAPAGANAMAASAIAMAVKMEIVACRKFIRSPSLSMEEGV